MIKIRGLQIKRFRSIMDVKLDIENSKNLITICGENNAGKTNVLRSMNIFFNPNLYSPKDDAPNHKYYASRGGAVWPEVIIEFIDDRKESEIIKIKRKFDVDSSNELSGTKINSEGRKKNKSTMTEKEINIFLKKIEFFYIESINVVFPQIIDVLIDNVYDIEYDNSRFSGIKKELKESYEKYVNGLQEILSSLANEINPLFEKYRTNWGVDFSIQPDIKKFRDIISDEVEFYINDSSNKKIDGKGSGLQRLAYILLHFRIINKLKKSVILLIDEPDVYLHEGLERKLMMDILEISKKCQVVITTHSKIFIDSYNLKNLFLLNLKITKQHYERKSKEFNVLETNLVKLDSDDGSKLIKEYLGIEDTSYDLLSKKNILVEGETDKYYLEELSKYFKIKIPNVLKSDGADKIPKWLEFYESYYSNCNLSYKPKIKIFFDNDQKGREVYLKIKNKKFNNIEICLDFIPNYTGEKPELKNLHNLNTDHQIEDFLYPELFCYLVNLLLKKRGFKSINSNYVETNISKNAHKDRGILHFIENHKNALNPNTGQQICFDSSKAEKIKTGLCSFFQIEGDIKITKIIELSNTKHPKVQEFLSELSSF